MNNLNKITFETPIIHFEGFNCCKDQFLGQSFVQSGCGRGLLQDEGPSRSRPHSFPGYPRLCFGMFPERFRSASVSVGSEETRLI